MARKIKIGALISGGGTNLQSIIDASESGEIDAEIRFVGSDNPEASGLARAKRHGIDAFVVDYREIIKKYKKDPGSFQTPGDFNHGDVLSKWALFPLSQDQKTDGNEDRKERMAAFIATRVAAEAMLLEKMGAYSVDLIVLAGFMRNFTPYFIDRVNGDESLPRIMNIHPALLPSFPGVDGYGDTFEYGCKVGGCTVHFVDYGEDSGPVIGQKAFSILPGDRLEDVRKKGLELEWALYPECIQLYAEGRLKVTKRRRESRDGQKKRRSIVEMIPATQKQRG